MSREGSVATGLPSIRDLDLPFGSSYMIPPIFARPPGALQALLGESNGSGSALIPVSSAPDIPANQTGDDHIMGEQAHHVPWTGRIEERTNGASSTLRGALLESVMLDRAGHQPGSNAGQIVADMGYIMDPHGFVGRRNSDEAMDAAVERPVDAELEAHYVAAIRQALARTEEAEADLSSIRNQLRMQDGASWGAHYGVGNRTTGLPTEGNLNNGPSAAALTSQLSAE